MAKNKSVKKIKSKIEKSLRPGGAFSVAVDKVANCARPLSGGGGYFVDEVELTSALRSLYELKIAPGVTGRDVIGGVPGAVRHCSDRWSHIPAAGLRVAMGNLR